MIDKAADRKHENSMCQCSLQCGEKCEKSCIWYVNSPLKSSTYSPSIGNDALIASTRLRNFLFSSSILIK